MVGSPKIRPVHKNNLSAYSLPSSRLVTPPGSSRFPFPELPKACDRSLSTLGILVSTQPNPIPMGRSRYQAIDTYPHFITCTVVNWLTLFSQPEITAVVLSSLKFLQSQKRLTLHAYVIMENHLHLIATADNLSREMQSFKSFTAKQIIRSLEQNHQTFWLNQLRLHKRPDKVQSTYQVWQEGFHPQMIQRAEVLNQKLEYIHNNPVRRGYVDEPWHWRYSSARNYAGQVGILEVEILEI